MSSRPRRLVPKGVGPCRSCTAGRGTRSQRGPEQREQPCEVASPCNAHRRTSRCPGQPAAHPASPRSRIRTAGPDADATHHQAPERAARSSYERVFLRTLTSGRLITVHLAAPTSDVSVANRSLARRRSLDDVAACTTRAPGFRRPRAGRRVEHLRYGASSRQTKDGDTWLHERSWACARLPRGSTPTCLRSGPRCGGSCSGVRSEPRKRE